MSDPRSGISIAKDPLGGYVGRVDLSGLDPRPDGKRNQVKRRGRTRGIVHQKLEQVIVDAEQRTGVRDHGISTMTVSELLDTWLATCVPERRSKSGGPLDPKTVRGHHLTVQHWKDQIGDIGVLDLKASRVDRALAQIGGARASQVKYRGVLKSAYDWSLKRGDLPSGTANPAQYAAITVESPKATKKSLSLTSDERAVFLDHVVGHRRGPMFTVLAITGVRPGELLGLRWEDVDAGEGTVWVRQSIKYGKGGVPLWAGEVKTGNAGRGNRLLKVPQSVLDALDTERQLQDRERSPRWPAKWDGLVFLTTSGTPFQLGNVRRDLGGLSKQAVGVAITPTDLRRTVAQIAVENGTDLAAVADLLGHETLKMARSVYTRARRKAIAVPG